MDGETIAGRTAPQQAFQVAALAPRATIAEAVTTEQDADALAILRGVLAQCDADVPKAVNILLLRLRRAEGEARGILADILAPMLVMLRRRSEVLETADILAAAGWVASADAFRSIVAAETGRTGEARALRDAALQEVEYESDDLRRGRVLQRIALASYYLHDYDASVRHGARSASLLMALGAWRGAGSGLSIVYNVHYNVTGDLIEANRYARLWLEASERSGDVASAQAALVAAYEIAVQLADASEIDALDQRLKSRLLPEQYHERFAWMHAQALAQGASDLPAMRTILQVLMDAPARTRGEGALCSALIALTRAAEGDDDSARAGIQTSIARLGRAVMLDPAYERRYRRLARATIAATCLLVGDDVRAKRTLDVVESRQGHGEELLPWQMRACTLDAVQPFLRGMAKVFDAAYRSRLGHSVPANLTRAEFDVLQLLGEGWSPARIATETKRSLNTVYNHTQAIREKLDVARTAEAIAVARKRGILR